MSATETYRLSDRYKTDDGTVFMTGVQALARLPIEQLRVDRTQGLQTAAFAAGYPGSPLAGMDGEFRRAAQIVPELPIILRPSVNEEHAASAVMGSQLATSRPDAQFDGVIGIWYGKSPGVDRAADALRHASFAGTDPLGGAVAVVGDDPKAKSSTIPSSSTGILTDLNMPVLFPSSPAEALELGRHAIAMSRATGLWVGLKIVVDVADGSSTVTLNPYRIEPDLPKLNNKDYVHRPDGNLLTPHTLKIEQEIRDIRIPLAIQYGELNKLNQTIVDPQNAWIGIITAGHTYRKLRKALKLLGLTSDDVIEALGIRLLKLNMVNPLSVATVRNFVRGTSEILVLEEKVPTIEMQVKDALYNHVHRPIVVGRKDENLKPLVANRGSLTSEDLAMVLSARLTPRLQHHLTPPKEKRQRIDLGISRTPFFCSGCPHNRSTVVPKDTLVGAGIGCHAMVMMGKEPRYGDISSVTCMGSEGTQWIGMSPFIDTKHLVQNIGDGTFFHSGQLAISAAIASGVNITYKLLWNGAVAMTGGQEPTGAISLAAVCRQLLAMGVKQVIVTSEEPRRSRSLNLPAEVAVWHRDKLNQAQNELSAMQGVTVLIHDQRCAAELRRDRRRGKIATPQKRIVINHRICEGCGDCAKISNCLSVQPIETFFGRKTTIDQHSCNFDYSCTKGDCPAFISITQKPQRPWRRNTAKPNSLLPKIPDDIAEPKLPNNNAGVNLNIHICGIGGTGVVTASQIIGTAAMLQGYEVSGLDQTGLSQKAGPVVSDIHISNHSADLEETNQRSIMSTDLLLAFDLLVATSWANVNLNHNQTSVVGSSELTPPGAKTAHPETEIPSQEALLAQVEHFADTEDCHWVEAGKMTEALIGDRIAANIFVVGMSIQAGLLPLKPQIVEEAIELNGVAVEQNIAALRWGRCQIADPKRVAAATIYRDLPKTSDLLSKALREKIQTLSAGSEPLAADLGRFTTELVAFQNQNTANNYLNKLQNVANLATHLDPDLAQKLLANVSSGLFKLTAYKDEYEVARLMIDVQGQQEANRVATPTDKVAWLLHPPTLRALGMNNKIAVSVRWTPLIRLLAKGKHLRGTPFDVFAWTKLRKLERTLPMEYLQALTTALEQSDLSTALQVSESATLVRGFENVKLANIERFKQRLADLPAKQLDKALS